MRAAIVFFVCFFVCFGILASVLFSPDVSAQPSVVSPQNNSAPPGLILKGEGGQRVWCSFLYDRGYSLDTLKAQGCI
jgi:hypothetical protein